MGATLRSRAGTAAAPAAQPTNKSWRAAETYIRVQGFWCYLYRAIDSAGATIDFLLSALRDAAAAERLFRQALSDPSHPQPRVINSDKASSLRRGDCQVKKDGTLRRRCRHRPVQSLNNILEQDYRAIKRHIRPSRAFLRSTPHAERSRATRPDMICKAGSLGQ
jgi:IS6 family transposase